MYREDKQFFSDGRDGVGGGVKRERERVKEGESDTLNTGVVDRKWKTVLTFSNA